MKGEKRETKGIAINLSLTYAMSVGQAHLLFVNFFSKINDRRAQLVTHHTFSIHFLVISQNEHANEIKESSERLFP